MIKQTAGDAVPSSGLLMMLKSWQTFANRWWDNFLQCSVFFVGFLLTTSVYFLLFKLMNFKVICIMNIDNDMYNYHAKKKTEINNV